MNHLSLIFLAISILLSINVSSAQDSLALLAELWGEGDEDYFVICASAGDLNGDGFKDIAVGAFQDIMHQPGYVKIFFGSENFDTIPDLKILGESKGPIGTFSGFGWSVASAGDINKDGYDDLIVGAPYAFNYYNYTWNAGKAYLYLGGEPMDTIADIILQDSDFNYNYALSVSSAGDVNGDGYDDVVVGAPYDHLDNRGRTYIYLGGENMDNVFDVYLEGTSDKAEELGMSVAGIADINRDGYDDVLIGAPNIGGWPHPIGRASIYFGGNPMDSTADITLHGDSIDFLNFGRVVGSAGDVNGDGIFDFLVGGKSGYPKCVKLFLTVPGEQTLELDTLVLFGDDIMPSTFGLSLSSAGDLNCDGYDDVIIGDYQAGTELKGKVYIFYGGSQMDSIVDLTLVGDDLLGSTFGYQVANAGDIDGDGYDEILVSSYGDNTRKGKVFVYTSKPTSITECNPNPILENFHLYQNYPNPFNSSTTIPFTVPSPPVNSSQSIVHNPIHTTLSVYNILGQKVKTLMDENKSNGHYQAIWDGKDSSGKTVPSGIYFCQLKIEDFKEVRKMVFLK